MLIAKYASVIILSDLRAESLFNLLVERMNIFTDPQKPLVVEEGIYPVNGPDEYSPVIITCNFALTYFIVNGEVEGSSAHLVVDKKYRWTFSVDCMGCWKIWCR